MSPRFRTTCAALHLAVTATLVTNSICLLADDGPANSKSAAIAGQTVKAPNNFFTRPAALTAASKSVLIIFQLLWSTFQLKATRMPSPLLQA